MYSLMNFLTLSYSSKINGYLYHQRVSPSLKKRPEVDSPLMNKKGLIYLVPC